MTLDAPDGAIEDETLRDEFPLRHGGTVGLTDEYVLVARDGETIRITADRITEATLDSIDWFLVTMGVVIVGFGVVSFERSVPGGLAFVAAGLGSLYLTYRRRDALRIGVTDRRKPVTIYPEDPRTVYDALEPLLAE